MVRLFLGDLQKVFSAGFFTFFFQRKPTLRRASTDWSELIKIDVVVSSENRPLEDEHFACGETRPKTFERVRRRITTADLKETKYYLIHLGFVSAFFLPNV
jgi:hypothetical protein